MSSASVGSRFITSLNVVRPIAGSVIPAVECSAMSIFVSNSRSNAHAQLRAPAPPVSIRVPSMSNRISFAWLIRLIVLPRGASGVATGCRGEQRDSRRYNKRTGPQGEHDVRKLRMRHGRPLYGSAALANNCLCKHPVITLREQLVVPLKHAPRSLRAGPYQNQ